MRLHRFCSAEEFKKFMAGEKLVNDKDHGASRGSDSTTAVGFCFFTEDPEKAKHWLSGIVDFDYCLTFDVPKSSVIICHGRYAADPGNFFGGHVIRAEFCCREYDNKTFKLIKADTSFRGYAPNASVLRKICPGLFI